MKSLSALIKLQKMRVDEQRKLLARLQSRLEAIHRDLENLAQQQKQEQAAFSEHPEMGQTYGDFVKKSILQGRELERLRLTAVRAVEIAHDKLVELFEEQKRYEIAEEARLEREAQEERRLERIQLDEVGSIAYARRMKE